MKPANKRMIEIYGGVNDLDMHIDNANQLLTLQAYISEVPLDGQTLR